MFGRRSAAVAITGMLVAAALSGINAATADSNGETQDKAERATFAQMMSLPTADSPAEARRLAAQAGVKGQTLTFVTHAISGRDAFVDVPPADVSPGDAFIQEARVFNDTHATPIGLAVLHCEIQVTTITCNHTISLNGRGKVLLSKTFIGGDQGAITGGTGEFRDVGGQGTWFAGTVHPNKDMIFVVQLVH